jgi:hypothetical protein
MAPAGPAATPSRGGVRFWLRPVLLSVVVLLLLLATLWDERRTPTQPVRPDVLTATVAPGATVSAQDPALTDTLLRLRTALIRRDTRALANLADPGGLTVAAYGGGLPESGYAAADATRLSGEVLSGSQVTPLGWRSDGRGRVIVLTDGWARKPLRLGAANLLELTPLSAMGLVPRGGTWYWHWLLPDSTGVLAQQARSLVWQPWPAG